MRVFAISPGGHVPAVGLRGPKQNGRGGGFVSSQPRKKGFDELQNMSQGGITAVGAGG
jgi:hypothetical protein